MTKRGRVARILARQIARRAPKGALKRGIKSIFGYAQATTSLIDNIKHYHRCPERYNCGLGDNRAKKNTKWGASDKRSECSGCKGFSVD